MNILGKHGGYAVGDGFDPLIVGVLNISPESFYKGSIETIQENVIQKIKDMISYGVKIIDVGALSTRPVSLYGGSIPKLKEEISRIESNMPLIIDIAEKNKIPISIDTQSSIVAKRAIEIGCTIVNDISGFKSDKRMANVIAEYDVDIVLMATKQKPGDVCGIKETLGALQQSIKIAQDSKISMEKIVIDPAFGGWEGKNSQCDLQLVKDFKKFRDLGLPIYVGVSRKSTIKTLGGGETPEDRLVGSIMLTHYLIEEGAHIIRTHDVKETILGLTVMKNLRLLIN